MEAPNEITSKKSKITANVMRELSNAHSLMQKRIDQRAMVIYHIANGKYQNSLIVARQLIFTSMKIWKEFDDNHRDQFEQNYFFRTSKNKQLTQYLLDSTLICKVFIKSKKRDDIIEVLEKMEIPDFQPSDKTDTKTQQAIINYNEIREIQCKICACLLTFIEMLKQQKIHEYAVKFYEKYTDFVKIHYGPSEFATALYNFASYHFQNHQYSEALTKYNSCLDIRKKNSLNQGYGEVLINSSICLRQLGQLKEAISRTKEAIQIYQDLKHLHNRDIDQYYLLLAKLRLQNGDFHQSYQNFLITYKLRQKLSSNHPKRIQIQLNLLFFYKTLIRASDDAYAFDVYNIKDKKEIQKKKKGALEIMAIFPNTLLNRQQFVKYDDFNSRMAHLNLNVTEAFFDKLNGDQIPELENLLNKLSTCSFQKGITEITKTSFFQEQKIKQLLLQANPHIKTHNKSSQ